MADKKKPSPKKTSSKKTGSKAIAKRAPSGLSRADTIQMPDGKGLVTQRVMQVTGKIENSSYSNPLPSPEDVAKYNKVRPALVECLMQKILRDQILGFVERLIGQLLAFGLGCGFLFVAFRSQNAFIPLSGAALWGGIVYFLKNKK